MSDTLSTATRFSQTGRWEEARAVLDDELVAAADDRGCILGGLVQHQLWSGGEPLELGTYSPQPEG